jgi:hypothetical protein|nr:MAG TPA: hypothetical protein [Caudoviricetes sp.]
MSNWGDFGWFGGLRRYERLFAGDLSDFICCDERFMLARIIREIYQLSARIYQGLAFEGLPRKELAGKMGTKWSIWEVRGEVVAWVCSSSVIVMLLWRAKVTKSIYKRKLTTTQSYSQLAVSMEFCGLLQETCLDEMATNFILFSILELSLLIFLLKLLL